MKQTSVDWLFQQLWETPKDKLTWHSILEKAKQMEKQQMIEAIDYCRERYIDSENYYNQKYGK
jgi:hypothetical protein